MEPQLCHVGIYVHDAETIVAFYQHAVGLTVTDRGLSDSAKDAPSTVNQLSFMVDTPCHVAQPHGDPIDFALADQEIYAQTEEIVRADPTFKLNDAREEELEEILQQA